MEPEPRRTCVGCRRVRAKSALLRVAATPDGLRADPRQRLPGRGAYVCMDRDCIETTRIRKRLRRALRVPHDAGTAEVLDQLRRRLRPGAGRPEPEKEVRGS